MSKKIEVELSLLKQIAQYISVASAPPAAFAHFGSAIGTLGKVLKDHEDKAPDENPSARR